MEYARARLNMVNNQLRPSRVDDPKVLDAMGHVPRERFLPKALRGVAYADEDLPLPGGAWLIEPLVLARLIQAAEVRPTDVVLVVGCATGYAGAVLARLAGTVILVEPQAAAAPVEALLDHLGVDNVVVEVSDDPAESGRIVAVIDDGRIGKATLFTKLRGVVGHREVCDAQTPPCPGLEPRPRFAF